MLAAKYGPVARLTVGPVQVVLVNEPELIQQILITDNWNFTKGRGLERAKRLLGEGLLTSEGELHRRQRRLMQPGFSHDRLRSYAGLMVGESEQTALRWQPGAIVDMHAEMMRLTLQIVAATLFGADIGPEALSVGESLNEILGLFNVLASPLAEKLERFQTRKLRRFEKAKANLDAIVYKLIELRRQNPGERDDLLSLLVGSHEEGETAPAMSDVLLRDEVMTLFLAGHETTANALTYTWWLLAQNPDAEARLHAELETVLNGRAPGFEDMPRLIYARQVFAEAMRLYPPAWIVGRRVVTPYRLAGYELQPETIVIVSQWVTHRDEKYFERALQFDPSRWEPEAAAARPRFSYFPFGAGARICIGEHFAWMEGVLALATLAQQWRPVLAADSPRKLELSPAITLRPKGGLRMQLVKR